MAAPAHYIRSIHTSFTNAPHSFVAPRSASAWSATATTTSHQPAAAAHGVAYPQPRRSSAGPKASLTSGYNAGYNALGAAAAGAGAGNGGAILNTHNAHNYTHHLQNTPSAYPQSQASYHGQSAQGGRKVQGQQQMGGQRASVGAQGGRRRSVSIRMPPTYSYSSANPSALAQSPLPSRPVSPSQLSAAAPVFTPRQALIHEATSVAAAAASSTTSAAVTPVTKKEKPTYKFDPFADDDVVDGDVSAASVSSSVDALTTAFGPYELQTIHIPPAAPRDIARYSPAPSRSPSPPSASLAAPSSEPLSAPPPTPKLSAAPLPSTIPSTTPTATPTATRSPSPEPLVSSDPFSTTASYSSDHASSAPIVNARPRDDYLARIVAGLLLQRQMSGRPRRRAVYATGCGGMGMYRKSRLSAGWVGAGAGAGVGEA